MGFNMHNFCMLSRILISARYCSVAAVAFLLLVPLPSSAISGETDRQRIRDAFRHQEDLVESMYAEFDREHHPTTEEQARTMAQVTGRQAATFIPSEGLIRTQSFTAKFWRRGIKQRTETTLRDSESAQLGAKVEAFDGQIVRGYWTTNDGIKTGRIGTAENTSWNGMPRHDPVALFFRFYEVPLSTVVDEATRFTVVAETGPAGAKRYRVTLDCGGNKREFGLEIVLDDSLRPLERTVFLRLPDGKRVADFRLRYSSYPHDPLLSGQTDWFPVSIPR